MYKRQTLDGILSKKVVLKGLIIEKNYTNNTELVGGGDGTPNIPIPKQKKDPNGFTFLLLTQQGDKTRIPSNERFYKDAKEGDSLIYAQYRGLITNILWKVRPLQITAHTDITHLKKIKKEEQHFSKESIEKLVFEENIRFIYQLSDHDLLKSIKYADSLIRYDASLDKNNKHDIQQVLGEILYDNDSIDLALDRFTEVHKIFVDNPRNMINIASCYLKKGKNTKALELIKNVVLKSHNNKWYLGNMYEIMRQREDAIKEYEELYHMNKKAYDYSGYRAQQLKFNKLKLYDEIKFIDRRVRHLFLRTKYGFRTETRRY